MQQFSQRSPVSKARWEIRSSLQATAWRLSVATSGATYWPTCCSSWASHVVCPVTFYAL